jgi:transcriptional regulator with XRE-family HTH domain
MDEELKKNLGRVARAARERLNLTQEEVARQVGFVTAVYGRIERGGMLPSLPKLKQLCMILKVSADEMLAMEEARQEALEAELADEASELRNILEHLQRWPPERRALFRDLVSFTETACRKP